MLSIRGCSLSACLSLLAACGNPSGDPIPNPQTRAPTTLPVDEGQGEIPVSKTPEPTSDTCKLRDLAGACREVSPTIGSLEAVS